MSKKKFYQGYIDDFDDDKSELRIKNMENLIKEFSIVGWSGNETSHVREYLDGSKKYHPSSSDWIRQYEYDVVLPLDRVAIFDHLMSFKCFDGRHLIVTQPYTNMDGDEAIDTPKLIESLSIISRRENIKYKVFSNSESIWNPGKTSLIVFYV